MDIFEKAIETFGIQKQVPVMVEEMAELTKELCKFQRGIPNWDNIIEELIDAELMLKQLHFYLESQGFSQELEKSLQMKVQRLEKRLTMVMK